MQRNRYERIGIALALLAAVGLTQANASRALRSGPELVLAAHGQSRYRIVVSASASPSERYAARELQTFLKQIAGATLPIGDDRGPLRPYEILLGDNRHLQALRTPLDFRRLGDEGFTLRTLGTRLIIAGGRGRGTLYGVYSLLEDRFGCRWFAPSASLIPKQPMLRLAVLNQTQIPRLMYRDVWYRDAFDGTWAARNNLTSYASSLTPEQGGKFPLASPFVHTLGWLLPAETYFKDHPEYYALVEGKRNPGQPDLTNPEVVRLVTERVKQWMRANPQYRVFSVTQNDNNAWCECPMCHALVEREGGQSGPMTAFVNQVAERIAPEFPQNTLLTFAYIQSFDPPKTLRPRSNVWVQLCLMEGDPNRIIQAVRGWRKVTDKLLLWDYVTGFTHYHIPFPNFYSFQPNLRFYEREGIAGVFEQGNYEDSDPAFADLRAYLLAKLLWNANTDVEKTIQEFTRGYYGKAAPYVLAYIHQVHAPVRDLNMTTFNTIDARLEKQTGGKSAPDYMKGWWTYAWPSAYVAPEQVRAYDRLFEQAQQAVANDLERLRRVQVAHMPIWCLQIESLPRNAPQRSIALQRFFATAEQNHITHFGEFKTIAQYKAEVAP